MDLVVGGSGQVGSAVVDNLLNQGREVRAIVRDPNKGTQLQEKGAKIFRADLKQAHSLDNAIEDAKTIFVLTPETGLDDDILGQTRQILNNYKSAIQSSKIEKVVGLSSYGAQFSEGTGNLLMSYMLEHEFEALLVQKTFIRPAYYFSNWANYLEMAKNDGVILTFFPPNLSIPMVAPKDVAKLIAKAICERQDDGTVYEIEASTPYSSQDVANAFAKALERPVRVKQIPRGKWAAQLRALDFSEDAIRNFIEMTDAVISGLVQPEKNRAIAIRGTISLEEYIDDLVQHSRASQQNLVHEKS